MTINNLRERHAPTKEAKEQLEEWFLIMSVHEVSYKIEEWIKSVSKR